MDVWNRFSRFWKSSVRFVRFTKMSPVHRNVLVQATGGTRETQRCGKIRWAGLRRLWKVSGDMFSCPSEDVEVTSSWPVTHKIFPPDCLGSASPQTVRGVQASEMFRRELSFPVELFLLWLSVLVFKLSPNQPNFHQIQVLVIQVNSQWTRRKWIDLLLRGSSSFAFKNLLFTRRSLAPPSELPNSWLEVFVHSSRCVLHAEIYLRRIHHLTLTPRWGKTIRAAQRSCWVSAGSSAAGESG